MPRHVAYTLVAAFVACACGLEPYTSWTDPGTTGDTTSDTTVAPLCGDGVAVAGEVCFRVERRPAPLAPRVLVPGDFDGDGARDYYADAADGGGSYWILAERPEEVVTLHYGWFASEDGKDHNVYRANGRDIDLDGRTDLLTLVEYHYWSGHVGEITLSGIPMQARPGFEFSYERVLHWQAEPDVVNEPIVRLDGTFADLDGDGLAELYFAVNPYRAFVYGVTPGAADGELLFGRGVIDLKPYGLKDNIVTVAADLDDDGRDDIILVDGYGRVWTFHSDPDGNLEFRAFTEKSVLPPMVGTVLARDLDRDGLIDLVGANTFWKGAKLLPGGFNVALGRKDGTFKLVAGWRASVAPTQTSSPLAGHLCYVHLVLLDLDGSGYPALIYALPEERSLVVHPQIGLTLGKEPVIIPLDVEPYGVFADPQDDGTVDLLVALQDDRGTLDDSSDDIGPFIDRYRLAP